jgi:Protein of unknown function (DUF732)
MFVSGAASLIRAAAVAAVLATASLGTAGIAAAYPRAEIFLDNLRSHGIPAESEKQAVQTANAACSLLAEGEPYDSLIETGVEATGMTDDQFRYFVEQSVLFYCPQSTPLLPH